MVVQRFFAAVLCAALSSTSWGACKILQAGELAVSIENNRVVTNGELLGEPVHLLIDTGASISFIWESVARRLRLPVSDLEAESVLGHEAGSTLVKQLKVGAYPADGVRLRVVYDSRGSQLAAYPLVLGWDFFSIFTTEFDLAHGKIRLLKPKDCQPEDLPYWTKSYSLAQLERNQEFTWPMRTEVRLNGRAMDAILDTGARISLVGRAAAARAGVRASTDTGVSGSTQEPRRLSGRFDTFTIGDETIHDVTLVMADLFPWAKVPSGSHIMRVPDEAPSMLIGCDFFLSHRIIVVPDKRKLIFTYNGGPVFQVVQPE
ncbi:MAG TPA: aspartyl protease family protein [Steroidobacteraceae bacterium]|nr:aspartyl protease family protein [Steroidobacteraceae bacterium]